MTTATKTAQEFHELTNIFSELRRGYKIIERIGEGRPLKSRVLGTFSVVYKAQDIYHNQYENTWEHKLKPAFRETPNKKVKVERQNASKDGNKTKEKAKEEEIHYVALKRISVTSSPQRLFNELNILNVLRGRFNVVPLITVLRNKDDILAILPFHSHLDIRAYIDILTYEEIRQYFRSLMIALKWTHHNGVIHRDVKPANFLWDTARRKGVLVDFGLAQTVRELRWYTDQNDDLDPKRVKLPENICPITPQCIKNDPRPKVQSPRAGTRGFRAPEVLLRIPNQNGSLDIWACGVILLSFLLRQFPLFASNDDVDALNEIAIIFGKLDINLMAHKYGRFYQTDIGHIPLHRPFGDVKPEVTWRAMLHWLNGSGRKSEEEYNRIESIPRDLLLFMDGMLQLDKDDRWTALQCLECDFMSISQADTLAADIKDGSTPNSQRQNTDSTSEEDIYEMGEPHDWGISSDEEEEEEEEPEEEDEEDEEEEVQEIEQPSDEIPSEEYEEQHESEEIADGQSSRPVDIDSQRYEAQRNEDAKGTELSRMKAIAKDKLQASHTDHTTTTAILADKALTNVTAEETESELSAVDDIESDDSDLTCLATEPASGPGIET